RCKRCCGSSCCYDDDRHMTYEYRISFWNLWYFWFVILFILMSCFGGCGYYKQRQRYAQSQNTFFGSIGRDRSTTHRNNGAIIVDHTHPSYYAYSGPGADIPAEVTMQPPPYSEVVTQPVLYPANKSDLPPYPGFDTTPVVPLDQPQSGMPASSTPVVNQASSTMPAPPAYSEHPTNDRPDNNQSRPEPTNQNQA
ncbi:hypothetical protein FSP39_020426, partial [Pinctada imbricata]